jgi:hypothetical protein
MMQSSLRRQLKYLPMSEYITFAYVVSKIESCRNIQYLNSLYNINMYTTFNATCAIIRQKPLGPQVVSSKLALIERSCHMVPYGA